MRSKYILFILLCLLFLPSCKKNAPPAKATDDRWRQYASVQYDPAYEITFVHSKYLEQTCTLSADRQELAYTTYAIPKSGNYSTIELIDLDSRKCYLSLKGYSEFTHCISFSPDGKRLVSGEKDGAIHLFDLVKGEHIGQAKQHPVGVWSIAYSPVEEKAVSGDNHGEIILWDVNKMQAIRHFTGHTGGIRRHCLKWSEDGKSFLSGSWDGSIRLWDSQTGLELAHLQAGYGRVVSIALSPDGKRALSSYLNGGQPVIYWDLQSQREIHRFGMPGSPWDAQQLLDIQSLDISSDGKIALFGLSFGTVIMWDLEAWQLIAMNRLYTKELEFVAFSADGKASISVGRDDNKGNNRILKCWPFPSKQ